METHFMKLLTNSYCADVASRGSLELVKLRALTLGGPSLWACVTYHFAAELLLPIDVSTSK